MLKVPCNASEDFESCSGKLFFFRRTDVMEHLSPAHHYLLKVRSLIVYSDSSKLKRAVIRGDNER